MVGSLLRRAEAVIAADYGPWFRTEMFNNHMLNISFLNTLKGQGPDHMYREYGACFLKPDIMSDRAHSASEMVHSKGYDNLFCLRLAFFIC